MQNFGILREATSKAAIRLIPIPELRPDYILVKVVVVALNPTDWTTLDAPGDTGTIVGCDYSGIVEKVGGAVTKDFKPGDRLCGFAHGENDANPENGAFARYISVKGDIQMHIPDNVSFETAATVGIGVGTAGFGLFKVLGIPLPDPSALANDLSEDAGEPVLIYGGSTATGTLAIQLAKLAGKTVVTTCSPRHSAMVKQRGADHVYDYRMENVGEQIREDNGDLSKAFDTVSTESTELICLQALGPAGGTYCNLLGINSPRADVQSTFFLVYSASGEAYIFEGKEYHARPDDFVFYSEFYRLVETLWAQGRLTTHPVRLESGGLNGVVGHGLQLLREGKVSGEKLVYRIDDTAWPVR